MAKADQKAVCLGADQSANGPVHGRLRVARCHSRNHSTLGRGRFRGHCISAWWAGVEPRSPRLVPRESGNDRRYRSRVWRLKANRVPRSDTLDSEPTAGLGLAGNDRSPSRTAQTGALSAHRFGGNRAREASSELNIFGRRAADALGQRRHVVVAVGRREIWVAETRR